MKKIAYAAFACLVSVFVLTSCGIFGSDDDDSINGNNGNWPRDTETEVVDVTNPETGRIWMDRNLGASRVATSPVDPEGYGDRYQWGRPADGHQETPFSTISALSRFDQPGHGHFITSSSEYNLDWRKSNGSIFSTGAPYGHYWSSTVSDSHAQSLEFSVHAHVRDFGRVSGLSVRCIKDE